MNSGLILIILSQRPVFLNTRAQCRDAVCLYDLTFLTTTGNVGGKLTGRGFAGLSPFLLNKISQSSSLHRVSFPRNRWRNWLKFSGHIPKRLNCKTVSGNFDRLSGSLDISQRSWRKRRIRRPNNNLLINEKVFDNSQFPDTVFYLGLCWMSWLSLVEIDQNASEL